MNYEELQCKIEELQQELEKAKIENERAYYKMILDEVFDIRILLEKYLKSKEAED